MKLFKLLRKANIECSFELDIKIKNVTNHSKQVKCNDIFVCIKGNKFDGHDYIEEAINNGARVIIYQTKILKENNDVYYIKVDNTKKTYAALLGVINKKLLKKINLIGVTGTNGKTTITTLIHNFFLYKKIPSMLIGTSGIYNNNNLFNSFNTTPDIDVIYSCIKKCIKDKIKYLILEVSSIAINELRVFGLNFNQLIMTNLTIDHLDYHKDLNTYLYTKGIVFSKILNKKNNFVVLNKDDNSFELFNKLSECKVISYGLDESWICAKNINIEIDKMLFNVLVDNSIYNIRTNLIGKFNVYNILAFIAIIKNLGFEIKDIIKFLEDFKNVPGRMQVYKSNERTLIIDYAHTPDGVKQVLETIRTININKVWVIIGCGGNRDTTKRKLIGEVLDKYVDNIILTNDNPRFEDEMKIIKNIQEGISKKHEVILDRFKAIETAYTNSVENDVILILGKGIEQNQIKRDQVIKYSDVESVKTIIGG